VKNTKWLFVVIAAVLFFPLLVLGQAQAPQGQQSSLPPAEDGIGVAPARFELPMSPGTEKTVIVHVIYNAASKESQPCRLIASLGDWTILNNGDAEYYKAGTQNNSACSWLTYSPAEMTALPGKVHPIRITISVPKDATPGDHLAALFVESRPDNLKLDQTRRQVILRFRMAALFYIMVPRLTRKGSLQNVAAQMSEQGIVVIPTLRNEGNSHLRPLHSVKIVDSAGAVVAELPESESLPVLAGAEISHALVIQKSIPPGTYSVRYRIDFKDGSPITEGQTELVVKDHPAQKPLS
jgi:methionine-rich copper-binding protein CopC